MDILALCVPFGSSIASRVFAVLIPWVLLAAVVAGGLVLRHQLKKSDQVAAYREAVAMRTTPTEQETP
jgi:uncharacterized protein (UPF0333 family)